MLGGARRAGCCLLGLVVVLAACGSSKSGAPTPSPKGAVNPNAADVVPPGDIPDNQVFVAYSPASGGYSLEYPQGWAQRRSGTTTTFRDHFNSLEVTATKTTTPPTVASARSSEVAKLRTMGRFKLLKVDAAKRTSGNAIRIVYEAASAPDPVTGKTVTLEAERYLFWHKDTLVVIALSAPKGSDNVDAWKTMTESLVWR